MTKIGLKQFRQDIDGVIKKLKLGEEVIIIRKSEPLFKISSLNSSPWEEVIDFTKIKKGGVDINDLLTRL
jgi:antitoxin (DNA-binding transcriptional repressor) of toxin-antitoxin stability system